jgi:hypothetical protein
LYTDHRFNLPIITGSLAFIALAAVSCVRATLPSKAAAGFTRMILAGWMLVVIAAIIVAIAIEPSFSPLAQAQSRYHPVFVSAALGAIMILLRRFQLPEKLSHDPHTDFPVLCASSQ